MKVHTNEFKENIAKFGREIDSKITYTIDGVTTELGNEQLNSVTPHYEGAILKSVMKQLDIDSNVEIPVGTELNYRFGVKTRSGKNLLNVNNVIPGGYTDTVFVPSSTNYITVQYIPVQPNTQYTLSSLSLSLTKYTTLRIVDFDNLKMFIRRNSAINMTQSITFETNNDAYFIALCFYTSQTASVNDLTKGQLEQGTTATDWEQYGAYDYINYGNYIVKEIEKKEDMRSWQITCYDKMLYSMVDYENMNITYPITIRDYINAICSYLGLTFKNVSDSFANYDKQITSELYLSYDNERQTYSSLGYTFRDVLDELAQVTASTICINEDDDELEVRYINQTVGKNLLNSDTIAQITKAGIQCTYDNTTQIITFNGTCTANNTTFYFSSASSDIGNAINGLTTISVHYINGAITNYFNIRMNDTNWTSATINLGLTLIATNKILSKTATSNYTVSGVSFRFDNGSIADNLKIRVMVANSKDTEYEPYGDTINEEYLKDINVNFGEKFGPVNTIVLSRSANADNIYYPTTLPTNPVEIKISDNQIMNGNNRDEFMPDIYNKLNGLEYYINDFSSTGICYYNVCDKYNIKVDDEFYPCIIFNDEVNITQGLQEQIYTDMPEETNTEYSKADSTDRKINTAYIIADKANGSIEEVVKRLDADEEDLRETKRLQDAYGERFDVIEKSFDDDGNVIAVRVKEGYTFDENGLQIFTDENSFKTQIKEDGMYFYDGNSIVGQYTKDGSLQKDLTLFGVYYYGISGDINDSPMFVAQLYTDENGEEAFGHFYNGGDY